MSKICLKNIKSQLRDCLPLQRSSRFAYSSVQAKQFKAGWGSFCLMTYRTIKKIGKLGFQTFKMKSRFCIFCLTKIYRIWRYHDNKVHIGNG